MTTKSFLLIQTAFTGDVILATALLEDLKKSNETITIDILVRKGNEGLFTKHPYIREVLIWNKKENKYKNLLKILREIRKKKYDCVINLQRFGATGILTALSSAKETRGFEKNPFSFFFTKKFKHDIGNNLHEIERNHSLISDLSTGEISKPKLYPSFTDIESIKPFIQKKFITIAPSSVWFTKTFPESKWVELITTYSQKNPDHSIYLLGSKEEFAVSETISNKAGSTNIQNLCGKLTLLQSAALMKQAEMNFVNDSAPMHLASAMNAPVTVVYCSTIPGFGFGPLSDNARIIETKLELTCRPCGLHGLKACPLGHFNCAQSIEINDILA